VLRRPGGDVVWCGGAPTRRWCMVTAGGGSMSSGPLRAACPLPTARPLLAAGRRSAALHTPPPVGPHHCTSLLLLPLTHRRVWDVSSGRCTRVLEGHTNAVYGVALSGDGGTAVSGSQDNTVRCAVRRGLERVLCCACALQCNGSCAWLGGGLAVLRQAACCRVVGREQRRGRHAWHHTRPVSSDASRAGAAVEGSRCAHNCKYGVHTTASMRPCGALQCCSAARAGGRRAAAAPPHC
jgi:hypothetical protein